jgi:hypothetical protein
MYRKVVEPSRGGVGGSLDIGNQESHNTDLFSVWIRRLAMAVGLLTIGTIFILGWGSLVESSFLIVATIVQPHSRQLGKWLMRVSASLLSVMTLPAGIVLLAGYVKILHSYHDVMILWRFSLTIMANLLVVSLDLALVADAIRQRKNLTMPTRLSRDNLDWVVWLAGFVLSVYYLRMSILAVHSYRVFGRIDSLIIGVALALVVLLFDLLLVVNAVRGNVRRVA